jgi:succinate-semialdehyde dehydrogenase/glutarate-semialdehyde dehydrogenase
MEELIEDAQAKGARLATGGRRTGNVGSFFEPTVLCDAPPDALAMFEEPFGPLALMVRVDNLDAALEEANRLPVGSPPMHSPPVRPLHCVFSRN